MAKNRRNQIVSRIPAFTGPQQGSEAVNAKKVTASKPVSHNPFEIKWSRQKHSVAGRDKLQANGNKTTAGKPVRSRAQAIAYRQNTLLTEWKKRNRKSNFQDKRIGERDATMSVEDKMLHRFAHQHKKKARGGAARFHLGDEVEDDDRAAEDMVPSWSMQNNTGFPEVGSLNVERETGVDIDTVWDAQKNAGGGRKSSDMFDVDDEELDDKLGEQYVSREHFGGGLLQRRNEDSTTHDQRINQIISESKRDKYEKQKAKDEVIGMTEEVDNEWRSLLKDGFNVLTMYERRPNKAAVTSAPVAADESIDDKDDAEDPDIVDKSYDDAYKMLQLSDKTNTTATATDGEVLKTAPQAYLTDEPTVEMKLQPLVPSDRREDSATAKLEHKKLISRIAGAKSAKKASVLSPAHIKMLKSFPATFRAFKTDLDSLPSESRVATMTDLLVMYHPSLDELNNKRIERLFSYVLLYILTSNKYETFTTIPELGSFVVQLWNFAVTTSLPQMTKFLAKIDADTDGCAPHGGHLAFLYILATLLNDNAVEFSQRQNDRERRSEQHASYDMLWKSTMLIIEKLIRKPARGRCAVFKCLLSVSIATDMIEARQKQNQDKAVYSTALASALERLIKVTACSVENLTRDAAATDDETDGCDIVKELFTKTSTWSHPVAAKCVEITAQLSRRLMQMWRSLEAFDTIFSPIVNALKIVRAEIDGIESIDHLLRDYAALKPTTLTRLHFLRQKPKPLPLLEPKLDMDEKQRSEKKQREKRRSLQTAVRKELKGAKREIRRDNQFLARQQLVEQQKLDEQRKRKLKELMHGLQSQEHEHKVMEKQKRRFKNDKKRIRL